MNNSAPFTSNPFFLLFLLISLYWIASSIRRRTGSIFANPLMLCTIALIVYLKYTHTPYADFRQASQVVSVWMQAAIVCLAVPLYLQWDKIRSQWLPIMASQLVGSIVGIITGVWIAHLMGASHKVSMALAAKSVTLPIALSITDVLGGASPISAAGVILAGLTGQIFGFAIMHQAKFHNPISKSIAQGSASHALGIAASMEKSAKFATYATLGLILNGVLTSILAPIIVPWLGV